MTSSGKGSLELDQRTSQRIYESQVVPRFASEGPPSPNPKFVIVGGQQGSGKTTVLTKLDDEQLRGETTQRLTVDNLMPLVPGYLDAAEKDSITAQEAVGNTAGEWGFKLMERAMSNRHNIVLELANPQQLNSVAEIAKQSGYQTELIALAVSKEQSWNAIVTRYERDLNVGNRDARFIDRPSHEKAYNSWPSHLYAAEKIRAFDKMSVVGRDGTVFHENNVVAGPAGRLETEWAGREQAMETMIVQRSRPWSDQDRENITKSWETNVKSAALARALPDQMQSFATDRAVASTMAKSGMTKFNLFGDNSNITAQSISMWVSRFTKEVSDNVEATPSNIQQSDYTPRMQQLIATVKNVTERAHEQAPQIRVVPSKESDDSTSNSSDGETNSASKPTPSQSKGGRSR